MIHYDNSFEEMEMSCDECSNVTNFEGDWSDCIDEAKRQGWKVTKDENGDWLHACPEHNSQQEKEPVWESE